MPERSNNQSLNLICVILRGLAPANAMVADKAPLNVRTSRQCLQRKYCLHFVFHNVNYVQPLCLVSCSLNSIKNTNAPALYSSYMLGDETFSIVGT